MGSVTNFLTNKHVVIAMIVAPILAILAYLATDAAVSEPPQAAQPDQSYPLAARSSCRWESGKCELENGDLLLTLRFDDLIPALTMKASHSLDGAIVQLISGQNDKPLPMRMIVPAGESAEENAEGKLWQLDLDGMPEQETLLRLVVSRNGSTFFAETGTLYSVYDNGTGALRRQDTPDSK